MVAHACNYSIWGDKQGGFQVLVHLEHHSKNVSINKHRVHPPRMKSRVLPGVVSHAWNPSIWEAEEEPLKFYSSLDKGVRTCLWTNKQTNKQSLNASTSPLSIFLTLPLEIIPSIFASCALSPPVRRVNRTYSSKDVLLRSPLTFKLCAAQWILRTVA